MKTYYMHTINGHPAFWSGNDEQICYMDFYGKPSPLSKSLKQIRQEQQATIRYRRANGFKDDKDKYGYKRVCVPSTKEA